MLIRVPPRWQIPEREVTPERHVLDRRQLMRAGLTIGGGVLLPRPAQAAPGPAIYRAPKGTYPVKRNPKFVVRDQGRSITDEALATTYNNFYELTTDKERVHTRATRLRTHPWTLQVGGLCAKPRTFDLDTLVTKMPLQERVYRFRCVERWSMTVPWTGFVLSALLNRVEPTREARYVRFFTVNDDKAPGRVEAPWFPWPYVEGLRIDEARHPLTLMVTGMYGKDLPRQNGAPLRLIVPWKYGYKSAKSLVRIELVKGLPKTFWNTAAPNEYGFISNVEPDVPHPRWSQKMERLLGQRDAPRKTLLYNGYAPEVAHLYPAGRNQLRPVRH